MWQHKAASRAHRARIRDEALLERAWKLEDVEFFGTLLGDGNFTAVAFPDHTLKCVQPAGCTDLNDSSSPRPAFLFFSLSVSLCQS